MSRGGRQGSSRSGSNRDIGSGQAGSRTGSTRFSTQTGSEYEQRVAAGLHRPLHIDLAGLAHVKVAVVDADGQVPHFSRRGNSQFRTHSPSAWL